jgi:hypothetical protein
MVAQIFLLDPFLSRHRYISTNVRIGVSLSLSLSLSLVPRQWSRKFGAQDITKRSDVVRQDVS